MRFGIITVSKQTWKFAAWLAAGNINRRRLTSWTRGQIKQNRPIGAVLREYQIVLLRCDIIFIVALACAAVIRTFRVRAAALYA